MVKLDFSVLCAKRNQSILIGFSTGQSRGGSSHLVWGIQILQEKLKPYIVMEQEWLYCMAILVYNV